jgi:hypothetical protein
MIYHDTEARLLLARERANMLAADVQPARLAPDAKPRESVGGRSTALLARLRQAPFEGKGCT